MSSILKALKKLEQEKAVRRERPVDLDRDILKPGKTRRGSLIAIISTATVAAVVAVITTYAIMGGFRRHEEKLQPITEVVASPPIPVAQEAEPVQQVQHRTPKQKGKKPTETAAKTDPRIPPPVAAAAPAESIPVASQAATPQPETQLPELTVTGIAYQQDSSSRFAIVNGTAVGEGGSVAGAKVVEIRPDRVRFSFNNRPFDILLGRKPE